MSGKKKGTWKFYDREGNVTIKKYDYGEEVINEAQVQEMTVKESQQFWKLYMKTVEDPTFIPLLLSKIPPKNSKLYIPIDLNLVKLEQDMRNKKRNRYLPMNNPSSFIPVIEKLQQLYTKPLPVTERSYL